MGLAFDVSILYLVNNKSVGLSNFRQEIGLLLSKFRAMSDFFNITLPEHNLWEEKEVPGTYKGITEGYFLLLNPLPLGNHTLYYEDLPTNPPNPNVYAQTVTYHLNVK